MSISSSLPGGLEWILWGENNIAVGRDAKKDPVESLVTVRVTPLNCDNEQSPLAREPNLQDEKGMLASHNPIQAIDGNVLDPFKSLPRDVDRPTAWLIEICKHSFLPFR